MSALIQVDNHIVHPDVAHHPVLFLDIDGVLAETNGGPIDRDATDLINTLARQTEARIVLCSDRVRSRGVIGDLVTGGLMAHYLRGQCDPATAASWCMSSKTARVVRWLELAQEHHVAPSRWCVLDDCLSFSKSWQTAPAHVRPRGGLVSRLDTSLAWAILLGKMPLDVRRREGKPLAE